VRCRYDEPGGARKLLSEDRDRDILNLRSEGRPVSVIAARFGISRRTVFRVLAHDRRG
jgi:DNA-binding CsgD family transcriptional regulator